MKKRIVLAGGSGFLGNALSEWLRKRDWEVVVLTRSLASRSGDNRTVRWDGEAVGPWAAELNGAAAVVNLAGHSVDCRYTPANRRAILESRIKPTRALGRAIASCTVPPLAWLNASSATIYRHNLGPAWDESCMDFTATPEVNDSFSLEVIHAWERALSDAQTPVTRKIAMRITMVLGQARNSVLPVLLRLARFGLGGRMGSGRQFVSWIHEEDFCRAVEWLVEHDEIRGPVNLASPNPLPNAEMMRVMRGVSGVPFGLPATRWMLEVGAFFLRTETELILKSRRVVPGRMLQSGFQFEYPHFKGAVENLCGTPARA